MKDPNSSGRAPLGESSLPQKAGGRGWFGRSGRVLLTAATAVLIWTWATESSQFGLDVPPNDIDAPTDDSMRPESISNFRDIMPSTALNWVPCYRSEGPFLCSRLTVPMDYHRSLEDSPNHPTVELALLLVPGKGRGSYGHDDSIVPGNFSISPLLVNPGGPGGSGVAIAKGYGSHFQSIIGHDRDILGFDPRGVGDSTPRSDCFLQVTRLSGDADPDPPNEQNAFLRRAVFMAGDHDVGIVNSSDIAMAKLDVKNRAINQLCDTKDQEEGDRNILRYVGTPNVARDMLSIVHAWDSWQGVDAAPTDAESGARAAEDQDQEHNAPLDTRGKLVYWGFSYGTLLGATFSAMFPHKIGRVILDGVCDADHYVSPSWYDSLMDADTIWDKFFTYCHEAKEKCAFYQPSYTVQDLKDRYKAIEDSLRVDPFILITTDKLPLLVTFSDLKSLVFRTLYTPIAIYPALAQILVLLEEREINLPAAALPTEGGCLNEPPIYPEDSDRAVMCGDKRYPLNNTLQELEVRFEQMARSSQFADAWMTLMLLCSHYNITMSDPPMRWGANPKDAGESLFAVQRPSIPILPREETVMSVMSSDKKIKTNFPLLLMTNTFDPVTPKAAAMKMTQKFVGARFLEQKALGHCTLSTASHCTFMNVRNYIREGILPTEPDFEAGEWTVCEADEHPWSPIGQGEYAATRKDEETLDGMSDLEVEMLEIWPEFQRKMARDQNMPMYGQTKLSKSAEFLFNMLDV